MTLRSRGLTSFHHFEESSWLLECNERLYCTRASDSKAAPQSSGGAIVL
jgi:hypothetical protein